MRSDLVPWTETARVSRLLCFSFAASGSPERKNTHTKKEKLRSDQHAVQSNKIKSNQESNQRDHPDPTPKGEQPPLTLFFLASRAAAADAGDAASLFPITPLW